MSPMRLGADRALPCRDVLLDPVAVCEVLAILGRGGAARVSDCKIRRINYQVGRSLRAVFDVTLAGERRIVAARMFRGGRSEAAYAQAEPSVEDVRDVRGAAWARDLDTVLWLFPNDRKIHTLRGILDNDLPAPGRIPGVIARREIAAYAPEKTATVACFDANGRSLAYAKVAAAHQAGRDFETYETLNTALGRDDPRLRLPSTLAYWPEHKTLWLEAVQGRRMADPTEDDALADLRRLGSAVAVFHGLEAPSAPVFDRFAAEHLIGNAALLAQVRSDVAAPAARLADRLASNVPADEGRPRCLHGDLHPKNAIVSTDAFVLIDLEDVARGPAAADLGSLLGALLYLRVSNTLTAAEYTARAAEFLAGYADVRPLPDRFSLAWHTSASLFMERAVRAVTRVRPLGLTHLGELVAEAERLLDRGMEAAA